MYTYQDLLKVGNDDQKRISFVMSVILAHKDSEFYKMAWTADQYDRNRNTEILQYQKTVRDITGTEVPDNWSPNYKTTRCFFHYIITQENQFLLGNGVTWNNEDTAAKLGDDFDTQLQDAGHMALVGGVSFGFFNLDHIEVFNVLEFAPLYDEENGSLRAGVRFWQIDDTKPLRATLYEEDGVTEYAWGLDEGNGTFGKGEIYKPKRAYILNVRGTEVDGTEIYDGENYPGFPIVPLWGNKQHQSSLIGIKEQIDAYDLIKNGFLNDLDNAQLYWVVKGAGGMDDFDLVRFLDRLRKLQIVDAEDGQDIQPVPVQIPYEARERLLDRIERDLFRDAMALNVYDMRSGAVTATEIEAAYEPLNSKVDEYEYCIIKFIKGILAIAGMEDDPSFTRSMLVNVQENIQSIVAAAQYLDSEYVTEKILTLLGDADKVEEVLTRMQQDELKTLALATAMQQAQGQNAEPANDEGGLNNGE